MGLISSAMKESMNENLKKQQDFMLETQQMQVKLIVVNFFYFLEILQSLALCIYKIFYKNNSSFLTN